MFLERDHDMQDFEQSKDSKILHMVQMIWSNCIGTMDRVG